jgi:hypothetical protein
LAKSRHSERCARESALPLKADVAAVGRESPKLTQSSHPAICDILNLMISLPMGRGGPMAYPVSPSQTGRKASVAAMNLHDDDTRIVLMRPYWTRRSSLWTKSYRRSLIAAIKLEQSCTLRTSISFSRHNHSEY